MDKLWHSIQLICLDCGMDNVEMQKGVHGIYFACLQGREGGNCNWERRVTDAYALFDLLFEMQKR